MSATTISTVHPNAAQFDELIGEVASIATDMQIMTDGDMHNDWAAIKAAVDHGQAERRLPVGSQIIDSWEKASGTGYTAPWDVVNYDADGNMELNWHNCTPDGVPFDEAEAIYYAPSGGLAAGQYYISIGHTYGTGWSTDKHINFTLAHDMAEGDQLVINCNHDAATDPTNGRAWNVYAAGSTTSKDSGTTSNSTDGTELGTTSTTSEHKTNGNINAISRVVYGSGRWSESAVRQWLNSSAAAGAWWAPKNGWDRPPAEAASVRGFLAGYGEDFLSLLQEVDVVTALNTVEGFETETETTRDKIYLPCMENWYINPQKTGEGNEWDYYKTLAQEAGLPGKFQQGGTYPILKKYRVDDTTSAAYVWLRSCYRGNAGNAWIVYSSGIVDTYFAFNAVRGCPACKILKST